MSPAPQPKSVLGEVVKQTVSAMPLAHVGTREPESHYSEVWVMEIEDEDDPGKNMWGVFDGGEVAAAKAEGREPEEEMKYRAAGTAINGACNFLNAKLSGGKDGERGVCPVVITAKGVTCARWAVVHKTRKVTAKAKKKVKFFNPDALGGE